MKKYLLLSALIIACLPGYSQKFRFGLHADPLLSWMKPDVDSIKNTGMKAGFGYGLTFDYNITDNYALATEITIIHKGGMIQYNDSIIFVLDTLPPNAEVDHKLQYIELPLSLKLKTNEIGLFTYFGQFGLSAGLNIKAKGNVTTPGNVNDLTNVDISEEVKLFNFGLLLGAGVEYSLGGRTSLTAGVYFNNGFIDVTVDDSKVILNNISVRVGFLF